MDSKKRKSKIFHKLIESVMNSKSADEFKDNFDKFLCALLVPILIISIIGIAIFGVYISQRDMVDIVIDCIIISVLSLVAFYFYGDKVKINVRHHAVPILYNLVFMFAAVRFYTYVGPSIWTFAFIIVVLSLAQNSKTMLIYTFITVLLAAGYILLRNHNIVFYLDLHYVATQLFLFIILLLVSRAIYTINNNHVKIIGRQVDILKKEISIRKQVQKTNAYMKHFDLLTGLPNKSWLTELLEKNIEYSEDNQEIIHLLFIDVDAFKLINDTMGHKAGDSLLKMISKRLDVFRSEKVELCRINGDEFLMMIAYSDDILARQMAVDILESIALPFDINGNQVNISCCIGISKYPDDGITADSLIKRADIAMYKAKQNGQNQYELYSQDMEQMRIEELETIGQLQSAILNQEFLLYYQPQVDGNTGEITGLEALIRWKHPKEGILSAGKFIPVAEKTGLIVNIGEWVLKTACRQNKAWQDEGRKIVPVAVNISINQIKDYYLFNLVEKVLNETGLAPEYLELEITESILASETEIVMRNLNRIRKLGVRIAIDDFGTGYSAMEYLRQFPIDRIKIPMNFVHGISHNTKDESIINVILALSKSLGIDVLAEGVETDVQLKFMLDRMCNIIQGYYFYKPMGAEEIMELFTQYAVK